MILSPNLTGQDVFRAIFTKCDVQAVEMILFTKVYSQKYVFRITSPNVAVQNVLRTIFTKFYCTRRDHYSINFTKYYCTRRSRSRNHIHQISLCKKFSRSWSPNFPLQDVFVIIFTKSYSTRRFQNRLRQI